MQQAAAWINCFRALFVELYAQIVHTYITFTYTYIEKAVHTNSIYNPYYVFFFQIYFSNPHLLHIPYKCATSFFVLATKTTNIIYLITPELFKAPNDELKTKIYYMFMHI